MTFVDANHNRIVCVKSDRTHEGMPLVVVRLVLDPAHGYIASDEGTGCFGDDDCPSSYGMPCLSWFGVGERFPTAEAAIAAIADE